MKKLLSIVALIGLLSFGISKAFSQTGTTATGNGIYAIIDTTYHVGSATLGASHAKITLKNTTSDLYAGVQFRVFYDKTAFVKADVTLIGSTSNLDLQYLDNPSNGYVTITLVYTGSDSGYSLIDGETFDITLTHSQQSVFYSINSISPLTWSGVISYPSYAALQAGIDAPLSLYSYGGNWIKQSLKFHGRFTNITGTPAKNLYLGLEKKVKNSVDWSTHAVYKTDEVGKFAFNEDIDTTYYDIRLAITGDTMQVGNIISTADAQLINQWALGGAIPQGFDFYTGDVNSSGSITITDAYGVFGKISGRFNSWPAGTPKIKFFTETEYNTIVNNPATNYTSSITGSTNFYYPIHANVVDSVVYYIAVPGDANGTGYNMARITPITINTTGTSIIPSQIETIVDETVEYDFPTNQMEISMPKLQVTEGNLVNVPVTIKTKGIEVSALQLGMLYDQSILEFKELQNSEKSMYWMSALNPTDGIVEWSGYDPSSNKKYLVPDNYNIFTLQFLAKEPQADWVQSPLWTTRKFSGDDKSKDMSILSANGIMVVAKVIRKNGFDIPGFTEESNMIVYPNPTTGEFSVTFNVKEEGHVHLYIIDQNGKIIRALLDKELTIGSYTFSSNIDNLSDGIYIANLRKREGAETTKILKIKQIK